MFYYFPIRTMTLPHFNPLNQKIRLFLEPPKKGYRPVEQRAFLRVSSGVIDQIHANLSILLSEAIVAGGVSAIAGLVARSRCPTIRDVFQTGPKWTRVASGRDASRAIRRWLSIKPQPRIRPISTDKTVTESRALVIPPALTRHSGSRGSAPLPVTS